MIWRADRQIQRFRVQTVKFNYWEHRPSNCNAVAAAAAAADGDTGDVDDGQKLDALEFPPRRLD